MTEVSADKLRKLLPGEKVLREPVRRLCDYLTVKVDELANRVAGDWTNVIAHAEWIAEENKQMLTAVRLLEKLITFGVPSGPDRPREELDAGQKQLAKLLPGKQAQEIYLAAAEHRQGRPVVRRHLAAAALEAKESNPQPSRLQLAQKFCPCGRSRHTEKCTERLRRDVKRLSSLIKTVLHEYPA